MFWTCRLQRLVDKHNLVVASYDVVRNDIAFFRYCDYVIILVGVLLSSVIVRIQLYVIVIV